MMSSGTSPFVRCTCSATGRILSSAKRRNVSATSSKSAPRWVGPVPCFAHWSASASRNAGARWAVTKACAGASTAGSTPQRVSRPTRRETMSLTASATYARASIDSTWPCSAYRHMTRAASTAAPECARSYAVTCCSSSLSTDSLPSERLSWARCKTARSTTVAARSTAATASRSWSVLMRARYRPVARPGACLLAGATASSSSGW